MEPFVPGKASLEPRAGRIARDELLLELVPNSNSLPEGCHVALKWSLGLTDTAKYVCKGFFLELEVLRVVKCF